MPKLTDVTKAERISQALQVLRLLSENPKKTQKDACREVGIEPSKYRFWITQSEEAVIAFRDVIRSVERGEMAIILTAKEAILEKIVDDGLNRLTDPATRLQIHKYLTDLVDARSDNYRSNESKVDQDLLSGPQLAPGTSKFVNTPLVNIAPQPDGSITISTARAREILEGEVTSKSQEP